MYLQWEFPDLADEHREWLSRFESSARARWERLLRGNVEAALCEAMVRRMLATRVDSIVPGEEPVMGGPDFRCVQPGGGFFVEVTCITSDRASEVTGVAPGSLAGSFRYLTPQIRAECVSKAPQCATPYSPCLLAIGTFHPIAAATAMSRLGAEYALTSEPTWRVQVNEETGEAGPIVGETALRHAALLRQRPEDSEIESARRSISGLLLCDLRGDQIFGSLQPDAARPFARDLLPVVPFCVAVVDPEARTIEKRWI